MQIIKIPFTELIKIPFTELRYYKFFFPLFPYHHPIPVAFVWSALLREQCVSRIQERQQQQRSKQLRRKEERENTAVAIPVLPIGDILANVVATFAAFGRHSSLWPKATTVMRSHRHYLRPSTAIVRCARRPQQLIGHR